MEKLKKWSPYLVITVIVILGLTFLTKPKVQEVAEIRQRKEIYNFNPNLCPGDLISLSMADRQLTGILEEGSKVSVRLNWYACNPVYRGDLVLYRYSEFENPVIRRVVGKPSDSFNLVYQENKGGWQLFINNQPVKGIGGDYILEGQNPPALALAEKDKRGVLGPEDAIIFSSIPPGDKDSGTIGIVSIQDLIGKVERKKSK